MESIALFIMTCYIVVTYVYFLFQIFKIYFNKYFLQKSIVFIGEG